MIPVITVVHIPKHSLPVYVVQRVLDAQYQGFNTVIGSLGDYVILSSPTEEDIVLPSFDKHLILEYFGGSLEPDTDTNSYLYKDQYNRVTYMLGDKPVYLHHLEATLR